MTVEPAPHEEPLKLVVFLADVTGGGAERMTVAIANGMAERGMEVDMVLAAARGPYLTEISDAVKVVDLDTGSVSRSLIPLARHLRRADADVMLTTLPHTSFIAVLAARLSGRAVPTVVREANTPQRTALAWSSVRGRMAHALAPMAYRMAAGAIAVSDGVKDAMVDVLGVPEAKIAALYNPVVTPELRELASNEPEHPWFAEDQPPVVLGVGSLTPRKDFGTLIEAFSMLDDKETRLVILGEGPERQALQEQAKSLGLTGRVDMPGFVQNPYAFMARAAVYVMSSKLEGLPGTLVQALACGCPAVSTDCPSGPREVLRNGELGPLVPVGDAVAMARAISATMSAPTDRQALIGSVERYDATRVLDTTYDYLVGFARPRARRS